MIRFTVLTLFICSLIFPLVSCTTLEDEQSQSAGPIEEEVDLDADSDSPSESSSVAAEEDNFDEEEPAAPAQSKKTAKNEDENIDGDFDQADKNDQPSDQVADQNGPTEDSLDNELGGDDSAPGQPVAKEDVGSDELSLEPGDDMPAAADEPAPVPVVEEKARVRDIRYLSNASGGTVVIEASKPITYQTRLNADTQQFIIEMANVELPANLQRPFNTKDFKSRIGSINAYQTAGSDTARVVIQLNGASDGEPVVQQEGASLVVIPPVLSTPVAQQPAAPGAPAVATKKTDEQPLAAKSLDEFLTGSQKFFGRLISLQIKDADIRDVVNFLAEESGANIVMSDEVKGHISLKMRKVPWDQALVTVMRAKDLGYIRQGNILRISTLKELQGEAEVARSVLEAQKAIAPTMVQVIPVSYANLEDMAKNLRPFLSKDGNIVADNRTNTLIATDKSEVIGRVQKLVKALDIPPAQVSIESKIVEALEEFSSFAGINWSFSGADVPISQSGGANGAPINLNLTAKSASVTPNVAGGGPFATSLAIGTLDIFGNLAATLTLAEQNSLAKVISSPRISTMNREKSTILQKGENISVIRTRSEQTGIETKSEKRTPYSLELEVTPQVTSDGSVVIDLNVKREFLGPVTDQDLQSRAVNTRSAKTKILVRNGQTAVIGGIYTSEDSESNTGVPGLMNIPIIGWFFKNKSDIRTKNELLIFLTPRILAQEEGKTPAIESL